MTERQSDAVFRDATLLQAYDKVADFGRESAQKPNARVIGLQLFALAVDAATIDQKPRFRDEAPILGEFKTGGHKLVLAAMDAYGKGNLDPLCKMIESIPDKMAEKAGYFARLLGSGSDAEKALLGRLLDELKQRPQTFTVGQFSAVGARFVPR
jgi:hypothetical protein